jgi:hypothetical protein
MNTLTTKDVNHVASGRATSGLHFGDLSGPRTSRRAEGFGGMGMVRTSRRSEGFGDLMSGIGMADLGADAAADPNSESADNANKMVSGNPGFHVRGWQGGGAARQVTGSPAPDVTGWQAGGMDRGLEPISAYGISGFLSDLTTDTIMGVPIWMIAAGVGAVVVIPMLMKKKGKR